MKSLNLKLAGVVCVITILIGCDKGKACECTTTHSNGDPDVIKVHEPLNSTSNPDCSAYEGVVDDNDGVTATTTCTKVNL